MREQIVVLYEKPNGGIVAYSTAYGAPQCLRVEGNCKVAHGNARAAESKFVRPEDLTT